MLVMKHGKYGFVKLWSQFKNESSLFSPFYVLYRMCIAWWWPIKKGKTCHTFKHIHTYIHTYTLCCVNCHYIIRCFRKYWKFVKLIFIWYMIYPHWCNNHNIYHCLQSHATHSLVIIYYLAIIFDPENGLSSGRCTRSWMFLLISCFSM